MEEETVVSPAAQDVEVQQEEVNDPLLSDVIYIDGEEYVVPMPRAAQSAALIKIFSSVFMSARKEMSSMTSPQELDIIAALLAHIDEKTLVDLAAASAGVDRAFAAEHFSFSWVMPAVIIAIRKSDIVSVIANFTSILSPTVRTRS